MIFNQGFNALIDIMQVVFFFQSGEGESTWQTWMGKSEAKWKWCFFVQFRNLNSEILDKGWWVFDWKRDISSIFLK